MGSPARIGLTAAALVCLASTASARGFQLFANAFLDSTKTPRTRITAEVSYSSLIFFREQDAFHTEYSVYLEIWRKNGHEHVGISYVMHGAASVGAYEETKKHELRSRTSREVVLEPGDYVIEATLRVKGTRIGMHREVELQVPDFLSSGIGFGTPRVMMVPTASLKAFARWRDFKSVPAVDRPADVTLAMFDRQPAVRFDIFLEQAVTEPVPCDLFYEVVGPDKRQVLYGKRFIRIDGHDDSYVVGFNVDDWNPGLYRVNLRAVVRKEDRSASTSVDVKIDVTRSMLTTMFDETLEIMGILYTQDELAPLRDADESSRAVEWARFWRARDPDPTTPENEALQEYIERVTFVERELSQTGPGWRSDRGRVYIRHGAPDQIDKTSDQRQQGEYEIWHYYESGLTFVFYDMFGVGDFKLIEGEMF